MQLDECCLLLLMHLVDCCFRRKTTTVQDAMQAEAAEMVEESFGKIILHTIGRIYTLQSAIYLGNFFEAQAAKMRQSVRIKYHHLTPAVVPFVLHRVASMCSQGQAVKSHLNAANLALKAMHRQQQMELAQKEFERKQQAAGVRDYEDAERRLVTHSSKHDR